MPHSITRLLVYVPSLLHARPPILTQICSLQADGRILSVYPKAGGTSPAPTSGPASLAPPTGPRNPPTGPRAQRNSNNDNVVDGTLGFADPMETDDVFSNGNGRQPPRGPKGLYSDGLVRGNGNRGGGRARGRGGRR